MTSKTILILLDADVVIHMFKADRPSLLNELFPKRLVMLDFVKEELFNNRTVRNYVENLFTFKQVTELAFPTSNREIMMELVRLRNNPKMGKGESACMAVCKYQHHIIASSNTKDIKPYCEEHNIAYLTTLDILSIAVCRNKISLEEGQECIDSILAKGIKLSFHNLTKYMTQVFDKVKLNY